MRIIGIGDTHGRDAWKKIVAKEKSAGKIVFVGDYFDTHDKVSPKVQIDNFKEIIEFKKANPEQVVLLFGNHDFHYLPGVDEQYSGYQISHALEIGILLADAVKAGHVQMCYSAYNLLFSHAGVTKTWCKAQQLSAHPVRAEEINELFKYKPRAFRFTPGERFSNTGDEIEQTPIWVRPDSLVKDAAEGYIHVVGHTYQEWIDVNQYPYVICIDALGTSGEYFIFDSSTPSVGRL